MARFALDLLEFAKRERVKEALETNLPDIDEKDTKNLSYPYSKSVMAKIN